MKFNLTMLLLSVVLLGSAGAEDYFAKGNAAFEEKDYAEAARLYSLRLKENPDDANAFGQPGADLRQPQHRRFGHPRPVPGHRAAPERHRRLRPARHRILLPGDNQQHGRGDDPAHVCRGRRRHNLRAVGFDAVEFAPAFADFNRAIALDSTQSISSGCGACAIPTFRTTTKRLPIFRSPSDSSPIMRGRNVARADAYRASARYGQGISDPEPGYRAEAVREAYLTRGEIYEAKGQPEVAIFDFSRAIEFDTASARLTTAGPGPTTPPASWTPRNSTGRRRTTFVRTTRRPRKASVF